MSSSTRWVDALWYENHPVSYLLLPLSLLFAIVVVLRQWLYSIGVLKVVTLPVPVIVVGNLTVGGTGKTPMVIALVKWLQEKGYRPGIVARGYGRDQAQQSILVSENASANDVGDEALVMARKTQAPLMLNRNRVEAAQQLVAEKGCNIIISDDGLQHYRLGRDIEILMIDGQRRYGNGKMLPAGPLREPKSRARHCDFCVVVQGEPSANEVPLSIAWRKWRNVQNANKTISMQELSSNPVQAFAAIGNPQRFFDGLRENQINYTEHVFPDHYRYQAIDFQPYLNETIVMTEKDAVKCQHMNLVNAWYVEIEASLSPIMKQQLLDQIENSRLG